MDGDGGKEGKRGAGGGGKALHGGGSDEREVRRKGNSYLV